VRVSASDDALLGIQAGSLPIIWDADVLYGPRDAAINVSSVFPFPEQAPSEIARIAITRSQPSFFRRQPIN
jgi:hypothetical protein